jgi:hypothetical protein
VGGSGGSVSVIDRPVHRHTTTCEFDQSGAGRRCGVVEFGAL